MLAEKAGIVASLLAVTARKVGCYASTCGAVSSQLGYPELRYCNKTPVTTQGGPGVALGGKGKQFH